MIRALLLDRRLVLSALACAAIAAAFWAGSRYPALNEKALMGGAAVLEDPLGFDAAFPVSQADALPVRIAHTTVNWLMTNRQGMTFGLLLGAGFLTLFRLLGTDRLRGRFASSLAGVVLGAPLGVCVNCAAPIARGLHAAGAHLELSLAAMVSSPTLNVVVLTMLFSLFPLYLVGIKLALSLLFMLAGIPLLIRLLPPKRDVSLSLVDRLSSDPSRLFAGDGQAGPAEARWLPALAWLVREYPRNLWFIVRRTVPLMLLAGLIGAVTISLLPWEQIVALLPRRGGSAIVAASAALGALGLLLPVPMAFDVIISAAMLAAGMPVHYVMVLLFSLGIFSVYSFLVLWEAVSLRLASGFAAALFVLSMVAGATALLHERQTNREQFRIFETFLRTAADGPPATEPLPRAGDDRTLVASLAAHAPVWEEFAVSGPAEISVRRRAFEPRSSTGSASVFSRTSGDQLGLDRVERMTLGYKFMSPYYRNTPIAAGDVNGDGRVDLLFGSDVGLQLFANLNGSEFIRQRIDVPRLDGLYAANAALVDLDNDGWLDIVASIYRGGNHVIYNDHGRFHAARWQTLPETAANLANALGFGDLDRDGDVDVILGNWTSGDFTPWPPEASRSALLWNLGGTYEEEKLPFVPGETLSTLFSDIDADGDLDLLVGNDFDVPDAFYLGDGNGQLKRLVRDDGVVPATTHSTMSIDSGDIDNDLRLEIYLSQITGGAAGQRKRQSFRSFRETCDEYADAGWRKRCFEHARAHTFMLRSHAERHAAPCLSISDAVNRGDCVVLAMLDHSFAQRDSAFCDRIPGGWEQFAFACRQRFRSPVRDRQMEAEGLRQVRNQNVLLKASEGLAYSDVAVQLAVDLGGWSWNAKFADLDNDEWQDLLVVSGRIATDEQAASSLYWNRLGHGFEERGQEFGLRTHLATSAYVYADLDDDGDLDIVTVALDGPVWVYRNESQRHHSIVFELDDLMGNRFAIGSKVIIHYGPRAERHQVREIKSSGGFISFDPPIAHFGLGDNAAVQRVEVQWSTGERSELSGHLAAGFRYRITRTARSAGSAPRQADAAG